MVLRVVAGQSGADSYAVTSASIFAAIAMGLLLSRILTRQPILKRPICVAVLSYCAFIGLGPLFTQLIQDSPAPPVTPWVIAVSWLGFLALLAGYVFRMAADNKYKRPFGAGSDLRLNMVGKIALALTITGLLGVVIILVVNGWRIYGAYQDRVNASIFAFPCMMLRPALFFYIIRLRGRKIIPFRHWVGLSTFVVFDLLWFGPIHGSRHQQITLLLALIFLLKPLAFGRRVRFWRAFQIGAVAACAILMILVWGVVRGYRPGNIDMRASVSADAVQTTAMLALYEPFDAFARIVDMYPRTLPYLYGESIYETLTIPIPRSLWPGKPADFGLRLDHQLYGYDQSASNAVPTLPGELYLNFGWAGVLVGMFATGTICRMITFREPGKSGSSLRQSLLYAATFPVLFDLIWGGTGSALWYLSGDTIPVLLAIQLAAHPAQHWRKNRKLKARQNASMLSAYQAGGHSRLQEQGLPNQGSI